MEEEPQEQELNEETYETAIECAYNMRKSIDAMNLQRSVERAVEMCNTLSDGDLSIEAALRVFDHVTSNLHFLQNYCLEEFQKGRCIKDLYTSVQHLPDALPRLYLMVAIGFSCVDTREMTLGFFLNDITEILKCLQTPLKGLLLRYFCVKEMKNRIPETSSEIEAEEMTKIISFFLTNIYESSKLIIRTVYTTTKENEGRNQAKNQLNIIIAENFSRLGTLPGISLEVYSSLIFPSLIEKIKNCKDATVQMSMMMNTLQTFPNEFHLHFIEPLIDIGLRLDINFFSQSPTATLIDIFVKFVSNATEAQNEVLANLNETINFFAVFKRAIDTVLANAPSNTPQKKLLELPIAFIQCALKVFSQKAMCINHMLESCIQYIFKPREGKPVPFDCQRVLERLLLDIITTLGLDLLEMDNFPVLLSFIPTILQRTACKELIKHIMNSKEIIEDPEILKKLISLLSPLIQGQEGVDEESTDRYEFEDAQNIICKLVPFVVSSEEEVAFTLFNTLQSAFVAGGTSRMKLTIPSLIQSMMKYTYLIRENEKVEKFYNLILNNIELLDPIQPILAIKLSLLCFIALGTYGFTYIDKISSLLSKVVAGMNLQIKSEKGIELIKLAIGSVNQVLCAHSELRENESLKSFIVSIEELISQLPTTQEKCLAYLDFSLLQDISGAHRMLTLAKEQFEIYKAESTEAAPFLIKIFNTHLLLFKRYSEYSIKAKLLEVFKECKSEFGSNFRYQQDLDSMQKEIDLLN